MQAMLQEIIFGLRMLRRIPGVSILAILFLTLGIGTKAAVFSWIEGILIRPYPLVAHQDRMFALGGTTRGATEGHGLSYPDFVDLEKNSTLFESFIIDRIVGTTLSVGDRAERATGGIVSANYFDALDVRPMLGRGFRPEEGTGRNAYPVTVISYLTWQDRYKGDPAIIGKTQYLNGVQHTIIGVAPEKFHGTFIGYSFNFWVPTSMQETFDSTGYKLEDRGARWIEAYAFLKPGGTRKQAQAELSAIAQRLENDFPETNRGQGFELFPLWKTPFNAAGNLSPTLAITTGVAFFVLLIACANVSNLLLARSLLRRHEMTMRLALGAGRRRLIKQLFTEGLLLSLIAAAGGIMVAYWCRNALVLVSPSRTPGVTIDYPGQLDWRVLALSVAVCIGSTMLFALIPAIQASHVNLSGALESEGYQPPRNEQIAADYNQVSEGYFATIGIPIVAGREFTRNDDENAPPVAIVNGTMAAKYWPGKDAVGQRLKVKDKWMEIVGVAKNANYRTKLEQPTPFFYVPVRQNFFVQNGFLIRTDQSAAAMMNALAREIHALDPNLALLDAISLQQQVDVMSYTQRLAAALLAIFGGMALFLAAIGLYAVMSYSVSQGTRELGMRMALGARAEHVLRLVISRGIRLTAAGIVIGAVAALTLTRLMGNLLYKVSQRDPLAFASAFVIMSVVALAACFLPAWRATRIDPAQALRDQ